MKLVYLASPYTHADARVREWRYRAVCRAALAIMERGLAVYSPIAHSHGISRCGAPVTWSFWEQYDVEMLRRCDELWVLMLPGWRSSIGVLSELAVARSLDIPVRHVSLAALVESLSLGWSAHRMRRSDDEESLASVRGDGLRAVLRSDVSAAIRQESPAGHGA